MKKDTVLLVHGLAESSLSMGFLAAGLRAHGYRTVSLDYPSTRQSIQDSTEISLRDALSALAAEDRLHIVTHSMGGIMLRYYLQDNAIANLGRIVMLAPGHAGSGTISALRHLPLFPVVMGPAGVQSADDAHSFGNTFPFATGQEVGIIAGCMALDPVAWVTMPWPNDGKITVQSTKLDDMQDHLVLPVTHDSILTDPLALYQTAAFLKSGRFERGKDRERRAA